MRERLYYILDKVIRESFFVDLTFEKGTQWGKGMYENTWGKNVYKEVHDPSNETKLDMLRNSKKASWVITGKSGKRWHGQRKTGTDPAYVPNFAAPSNLSVSWHCPQHSLYKKKWFSLNPTCVLHNWTMLLASAGKALMLSS